MNYNEETVLQQLAAQMLIDLLEGWQFITSVLGSHMVQRCWHLAITYLQVSYCWHQIMFDAVPAAHMCEFRV